MPAGLSRPLEFAFLPTKFSTRSPLRSPPYREDRQCVRQSIEAIRRISGPAPAFSGAGVSNISFGLSPATRIVLNSVFLHECCRRRPYAAIISSRQISCLAKIMTTPSGLSWMLINDARR